MSKKFKSRIVIDQGFSASASYTAEAAPKIRAHESLDFSTVPNHEDPDETDRKRKLAMMYAARDKAARPWCPICNVHKVGRVGKGIDAPLDNMCSACGKASIELGPRRALDGHMRFCNWCGKKKIKPESESKAIDE